MTSFFDAALNGLDPVTFVFALAIGLLAGFVKGAVGFAMPMILISGLGSILPAELALAALILPTLVTNGMQALRQGTGAAVAGTLNWVTAFFVRIPIVLSKTCNMSFLYILSLINCL